MHTNIAHSFSFLAGGNSDQIQVSGWSSPEKDHTWSLGTRSIFVIEKVFAPYGFFLEIDWQPFVVYPYRPSQSIVMSVMNHQMSPYQLTEREVAGFYCPPLDDSDNQLLIVFEFPDAERVSNYIDNNDSRVVAVAFKRVRILTLTEPPPARLHNNFCTTVIVSNGYVTPSIPDSERNEISLRELVLQFEMLAGNCDCGLAMRTLGVEQLSLLRFAGATAEAAIRGLESGFAEIGEDLTTEVADNPIKEWMVRDGFGLRFHTHQSSNDISEHEIIQRQRRHIDFLRRKFIEDVQVGAKIFIYADHMRLRTFESAVPLFLALNRHSRSRMLWVCPNVGETQFGRVDELLPGFARASLDTYGGPLEAGHIPISGWLNVLFNASVVLNRNP